MGAPYATVSDMTSRWPKAHLEKFVSTISGTSPNETNTVLTEYLDEQSDEIESYVRAAGYAVPLSSTPGVIKRCCVQMTYYELWDRVEAPPPGKAKDDNDYWVQWLKDLAKGKVKLDVSTEPDVDTGVQDIAQISLGVDDLDLTDGKTNPGTDYDELGGFRIGPHHTGG